MNKNKFFMAGYWKMNVPSFDAKEMVEEIAINDIKNVDVPPFTSRASKKALNDSLRVMVVAQNFYPEKSGAYTGEISAIMLHEIGVTNDFINKTRIEFSCAYIMCQ